MIAASEIHRFSHEAMTTTFDVLIIHPDKQYAGQAAKAVFDEFSRLERLLSRFDPGTDLAQVNRMKPGQFMAVNLEIVECLEVASRAYVASDGAFDVAYRSRAGGLRPSALDFLLLSRPENHDAAGELQQFLVGFGPDAEAHGFGQNMAVPIEARALVQDKETDPTPPDGLNLDLGGIGKGYALDKAWAILDDWEIDNALLSSGTSTVTARGPGPEGSGWPVGVGGDYGPEIGFDRCMLSGDALSGSGTAIKGEHIRTPETGLAADAIAAWVKAPTAAWTDAISTALMILPPPRAVDLCTANPDTSAIVVYKNGPPVVSGDWASSERPRFQ